MAAPTFLIRYTTDDASDTTPSWTTVDNANVRSWSTSRGRESELGRVEAGTAEIVLNNRTRLFDPQVVTGLRPMNRWWIQLVHNAVTYDVFYGYAESYDQQWPATGKDAVTVVRLVDEFKVLALDRLPVMDPPRDSYADVVLFDEPQGYWQMQGLLDVQTMQPTVGSWPLGGSSSRVAGAIVGDPTIDYVGGVAYGARSQTIRMYTQDTSTLLPGLDPQGPGDAASLSAFTYEQWFKSSEATPAANRHFVEGPYSPGPLTTWTMLLTTTGKIAAQVVNSSGTLVTATGATSISANTWYHVALVYTGTNILVYLNGVQDASAAQTGSIATADTGTYMALGRTPAPGGTRHYDEVAFYRYALPATRVLAHYTAGVNRGFPAQDPGARISAVLAASTSIAASSVRSGSREMIPTFMRGQSPLEELRKAEAADNVDAILFISANGTITFLDDGHRSVSPWNTVQATFDDDGTDVPYADVQVDYSETFLFNKVDVTKTGGTTDTSSDATSISRYLTRPLPLTDLPITDDADVTAIGDALLAKYKDPMNRVTSLTCDLKNDTVSAAVLGLELADRVRILRTQPGGGARIDQTSFVQQIQFTATPYRPIQVRLSVSPL